MKNDYDPLVDTFDGDIFEHDDEAWAEASCSLMPDGSCGQAGSEYCEFECPFR